MDPRATIWDFLWGMVKCIAQGIYEKITGKRWKK